MKHLYSGAVFLALCFGTATASATSVITNGDFSDPTPLAGFTQTGSVLSEPTGEFGQLGTDGSFIRTLEQTFTVPSSPTSLSFDFAFSTQAVSPIVGFPDSFGVSLITTADSDFLDILVVDVFGVVPDPSDGIEGLAGATPIDVVLDPSVTITGFVPYGVGTTFSGRISLALPGAVLGEEATLFFDLFDQFDGASTIAAVDNITLTTASIPAPTILALIAAGLVIIGRPPAAQSS